MQGVGDVIADAAYDADPLRTFIADDLGATAQIKANSRRAITPPIDWRLYKERHQVECFFNKLGTHINVSDGADNGVTNAWRASLPA